MKVSTWGFRKSTQTLALRKSVAQIDSALLPASLRDGYGRTRRVSPSDPLPYVGIAESLTAVPNSTVFFDPSRNLLSDEIVENEQYFPGHPLRHRKALVRAQNRLLIRLRQRVKLREGVHLFGEYDLNYFHWLVEILPRALAISSLIRGHSGRYGPVVIDPRLPPQQYEALRLVLGAEAKVLRPEIDRLVFAESWLISSPPNRVNDVFDRPYLQDFVHIDVSVMRVLSDFVTSRVGRSGRASRAIYIQRPSGRVRSPDNQAALISKLVAKGFEVVSPEQLSFAEQVRLFQSAAIVVAPSGAALANMLWMQPGTTVIVLAPRHPYKAYPYWEQLAASAQLNLHILWQAPLTPIQVSDEATWHSDYHVNVSGVLRAVEG
jgi:hypothetical protein